MASETKYFVLNRCSDWKEKSFYENLDFIDDMMVSQSNAVQNGVYISSAFDGEEIEINWHRLRLEMDIPENSQVRLKAYASDSLTVTMPAGFSMAGESCELDEYLLDPDIDTKEKLMLFDVLGAKLFENPKDACLYSLKGRYLWISIELINYEDAKTFIKKLKIEFPRISFVEFLPQIYRGGPNKDFFLSRFIAMFQSVYLDMEENIRDIPRLFNPDTVDAEFLNWLAEWFSIDYAYIWGDDKLREFLKSATYIYKMKGTKESISKIIDIYMGVKPIIIEKFTVSESEHYQTNKEMMDNLFGTNRYTFSVIIKSDKAVDAETYGELIRIINLCKPIDAICNLVILNSEIYLDHHSYLGINSYTTKNQGIILDEDSNGTESTILVNNSKNV